MIYFLMILGPIIFVGDGRKPIWSSFGDEATFIDDHTLLVVKDQTLITRNLKTQTEVCSFKTLTYKPQPIKLDTEKDTVLLYDSYSLTKIDAKNPKKETLGAIPFRGPYRVCIDSKSNEIAICGRNQLSIIDLKNLEVVKTTKLNEIKKLEQIDFVVGTLDFRYSNGLAFFQLADYEPGRMKPQITSVTVDLLKAVALNTTFRIPEEHIPTSAQFRTDPKLGYWHITNNKLFTSDIVDNLKFLSVITKNSILSVDRNEKNVFIATENLLTILSYEKGKITKWANCFLPDNAIAKKLVCSPDSGYILVVGATSKGTHIYVFKTS